jgi:uncharacterized membrane protein
MPRRRARRIALALVAIIAVSTTVLSGVMRGPHFIPVFGRDVISIDLHDLGPGSVNFYSYQNGAGEQLRFLLARDSSGNLHGAMNACRRCYLYRKGYTSSGGYLVCRYCGNRYKLEEMSRGSSSCVPISIPVQVKGQTAQIKRADLEREAASL